MDTTMAVITSTLTLTRIPDCIYIHLGSIHTEDTTTVTLVTGEDITMVITAVIMAMAGIGIECG